jgi:hypothetical protein
MSQDVSALAHRDPDGRLMRIDPLHDQPVWIAGDPPETVSPSQTLSVEPVCGICKGARWFKEMYPSATHTSACCFHVVVCRPSGRAVRRSSSCS